MQNKYWLKTISDDEEALNLGIGQARRPLSRLCQARSPLSGLGPEAFKVLYTLLPHRKNLHIVT